MDELNALLNWKSKGELCYLARLCGHSWVEIEGVCSGGRVMAMRWARRRGAAWPVVDGERIVERSLSLNPNVRPSPLKPAVKPVDAKVGGVGGFDGSHLRRKVERGVEEILSHEAYTSSEVEDGLWVRNYLKGIGISLTKGEVEEVLAELPSARLACVE